LHWAAIEGHKEIAELLIAAGADVNAKDDDGYTPLDLAIDYEEIETADLLRKHGGKHGTIHIAILGGDAEGVKEFLAGGADVNAKNRRGWTPLHYAKTKEVIKMLIKKGADVNAKNQQGWTPLGFAVANGDKETAELLIEKGADMNAKDDVGMTPLHVAAQYGRKEIAELLIVKGADVNTKDENSLTPLDLAIQNQGSVMYPGRQEEIADLLRKHGGKTGEELKAEGK
jgi:ankyrin repeat protein